ncbi:MAG: PadR family transcriptional regulator [Bianqueaceae bacterium]
MGKSESVSADSIRGHIDTILLRILDNHDSYGYELIKRVSQKSDGRYELKEPSLYTSLRRLEGQQCIESISDESQEDEKYTASFCRPFLLQANLAAEQGP